METGYSVNQVMTAKVLTNSPEATILDCAKKMADEKVGSTVIVHNERVVGILTEQDLARKVVAQALDPKQTPVETIMEKQVRTIPPELDVYDAMVEMGNQKIKHLPVVQDTKLVGIVSFKDVIAIQPDLIDLVEFKSNMKKENTAKKII